MPTLRFSTMPARSFQMRTTSISPSSSLATGSVSGGPAPLARSFVLILPAVTKDSSCTLVGDRASDVEDGPHRWETKMTHVRALIGVVVTVGLLVTLEA